MPDVFSFSDEMKQYFDTLPLNVQETIVQSSVKVNCKADLETVAKNLMRGNHTNNP